MNKKSSYLFYIFIALFVSFACEYIYLFSLKSPSKIEQEKKFQFVSSVGLPDLAISNGATYIRHRTLVSVGDIYKDDGVLREYFPSTFSISTSHINEKNNEK